MGIVHRQSLLALLQDVCLPGARSHGPRNEMPTYQYACTNTDCGNRFELVQKFTDPAASECPVCDGPVRKVYSSVGVVFKGSGFYRTDSRAEARSGGGSRSGSGSSSESESKSSTKSDSKSESSNNGSNTASNASSNTSSSNPAKAASSSA